MKLPIKDPCNPTPSDFRWGEVHPYLKLMVSWCRGRCGGSNGSPSLRFCEEFDENLKLLSPLAMAVQEQRRKKSIWKEETCMEFLGERKEIFKFLFIFIFNWFSMCHFSIGTMSPHIFVTCSAKAREKFGLLDAKSSPRYACQFPGSSFSRFSASIGARFRR